MPVFPNIKTNTTGSFTDIPDTTWPHVAHIWFNIDTDIKSYHANVGEEMSKVPRAAHDYAHHSQVHGTL